MTSHPEVIQTQCDVIIHKFEFLDKGGCVKSVVVINVLNYQFTLDTTHMLEQLTENCMTWMLSILYTPGVLNKTSAGLPSRPTKHVPRGPQGGGDRMGTLEKEYMLVVSERSTGDVI